jgi:TRAP-type C4-dicarboxylate transport system permease small subunit
MNKFKDQKKPAQSQLRLFFPSFNWLTNFLGTASGILSFCIVLLVTADVIIRAMRFSISGTLEISRLTLAWICFASLVYTYRTGQHVRVTVFIDRLGKRSRALAEAISCLFGSFLMMTLFFGSVPFFLDSWKVREVFNIDIDLPYWLAKFSVPVGSLAFGLVYLVDFFSQTAKAFSKRKD